MILFADLHGQRERLQRLVDAHRQEQVLGCGDILGDGDNEGCVQLLARLQIPTVRGNHEVDLLSYYRAGLSPESLEWLRQCPLRLELPGAVVTHCLVEETGSGPWFRRIKHPHLAQELLERNPQRLAFTGHTHEPGWWETSSWGEPCWRDVLGPTELRLRRDTRYIIVVGSLAESHYVQWAGNLVSWRRL